MTSWKGSRFTSPLLGDSNAAGGILENVGDVNQLRSPYKIWIETFDTPMVNGDLQLSGATVSGLDTPTSATESVGLGALSLLINPGTKVDSGTQVQFDAVSSGTAANDVRPLRILGQMTSTPTLMDNRELFFQTRVGIQSDTALKFDGHILIGWMTKDISLLANTTGVPSVAAGGGFGFHINGDPSGASAGATAYITPFCTADAITADPTLNTGVVVPDLLVDLDTASYYVWYTLGAKMRCVDASAGTGVTDFYINGRLVDSIVDSNPMDSTEVYSMSYVVHNGPEDEIDVVVDYVLTGATRGGLHYPYDTTADILSF